MLICCKNFFSKSFTKTKDMVVLILVQMSIISHNQQAREDVNVPKKNLQEYFLKLHIKIYIDCSVAT